MARDEERRIKSLPLRPAYARRREWIARLATAQSVGNEELARQAARIAVLDRIAWQQEIDSQTVEYRYQLLIRLR
jgi:hypothetical protein